MVYSIPALLNAKSSRPNVSRQLYVLGPAHVAPNGERPPALFLNHVGRLLVALFRHVGDDHAGALARERHRRGAADAVRCSGYERNPPSKPSLLVRRGHCLLLSALG